MIESLIYEIQNDFSESRQEAEVALRQLIKTSPYFDHAYIELANIFRDRGEVDKEIHIRKELEGNVPGIAANRFAIGTLCLSLSQCDEARKWFDKGLNSPILSQADRMQKYGLVTKARLLHDVAQLDWLIGNQLLGVEYSTVRDAYYQAMDTNYDNETVWRLPQDILLEISPFYRRCLVLNPSSKPRKIIRSDVDWQEVLEITTSQQIEERIAVVDDFLEPECLEELWQYCLSSTIWHNDSQKGASYIGAYHHNGFSSPLINRIGAHIGEHISSRFDNQLSQIWAYRNIHGKIGIGTHADDSYLNANIWLTPESANRNTDSGGLMLYKKGAPDDWKFDDYNNNENKITSYLEGAEMVRVPYKRNRVIFFDSRLFHASDKPQFGEALEEMRLNVTFLYGKR